MVDTQESTLLVTGASGHLGRRVVELLLEAGAGNVIATTRTPEKLADFAGQGVDVRHADFDEPGGLVDAFRGADRLLLISTDAAGVPGKRIEQHRAAVKAAEEAGVKHILYTSLIDPGPGSPVGLAPDHYSTEQAMRASSMGWTMLRNSIYTNTLIGVVRNAIQAGGKLFAAAEDGRVAYVTREDCARAAAAALAASFEGQQVLDITGPETISQADLAAIASEVTGQPIAYVPVSRETLIDNMVKAGLPRPAAELYTSFDVAIAQGVLDVVSDDFEDLTGRKPTGVADFLAAHREELVSSAEG
jgi:NAD(P)H dehydrogenase (quinone)